MAELDLLPTEERELRLKVLTLAVQCHADTTGLGSHSETASDVVTTADTFFAFVTAVADDDAPVHESEIANG